MQDMLIIFGTKIIKFYLYSLYNIGHYGIILILLQKVEVLLGIQRLIIDIEIVINYIF
jgi:hypothetical protein